MGFMRPCCNVKAEVMRAWLFALLLACGGGATDLAVAAEQAAQGTVEVLFSPWDDAEGAVVQALSQARQSIHMQAYLLTSRPIAAALIAAAARGVKVAVLADREMAIKGANSLVPTLVGRGVSVWLETRYAAAHNKVIIIDALTVTPLAPPLIPMVITGSYNYTWSAQARNAENLLLLRGDVNLTKRYLDNWLRHQSEAQVWSEEGLK